MKNPFDVLGINTTATPKQIEKAYNKEVKNAQRDITNESALETKLSELSWALTELLNENSRDKYEIAENKEVAIKDEGIKTKNIVLKYILCIFVALSFCIKFPIANVYTLHGVFGDNYYYIKDDTERIILVVCTILVIAFALIGFWLLDLIARKMFATSEDDYAVRNITRWIIIVLNSIVLFSSIITASQERGGDGFATIGYMIPDVLTYALIIIATFIFVDRVNKRDD